jgi:tetratricopeptide (TPR) repeat protein
MRAARVVLSLALAAPLPACRLDWNERVTGTMIGAGAGALAGGVLGSAVGSTPAGVVLGAAAGGAAGYIIGDWMADKREREWGCGAPPPCQAPSPCEAPPAPVADAARGSASPAADAHAAAKREYEAGRRSMTANEALAHYDAAIRLDPRAPEPWNAKGLVLLYGDRRDEARAAFKQALAVDPTYKPAQTNLTRSGG